jgi:HNH endonuclease
MKLRAYLLGSYLYSDIFSTVLYTLQHDGKNIEQNFKVRFYISYKDILVISLTDTGSPDQSSEGKTIDVKLGICSPDGTLSSRSILLGKAHFSSMAEVYDYEDYDSSVDRYKTIVREKGKPILELMRGIGDKTNKIQEACHKFTDCTVKYHNDLLGYVNSKGEFNPIFRRVIKTHTPLIEMQSNTEAMSICKQWEVVRKHCLNWLQENLADWLVIEPAKQIKHSKKRKRVEPYNLVRNISFMAKQTVRWGNPVFTDTVDKQPASQSTIHQQLTDIVADALVGNRDKKWDFLRSKLLQSFIELWIGKEEWDSFHCLKKEECFQKLSKIFQVYQPNDLFSPSNMRLQGENDKPPSPIWFRIIEDFYKDFGINLVYTDYHDTNIRIEFKTDVEPQEVTKFIDEPLTNKLVLNDQSVISLDPIDLLSERLASEGFFDDVNDSEKIKRYIVWRRGQPEFRRKLLDTYGCCVITGCTSEDALEAAHISPYSHTQNNDPVNGLLLRADIHTLFDRHLIGIDPEKMTVCVAQSLLEDYGQFNGKSLQLPENDSLSPDRDSLKTRYEEYKKRLDGYY